jgi:Methyltransferase domain
MRPEVDPDVEWVARLAGVQPPAASRALEEAQAEGALFRHLEKEHRAEGRSFYIEIEAPLELYALVRLLRPRHVVEVGVSSGVSSAYFLRALDRNGAGTLHSVDLPKLTPRSGKSPRPGGASWSIPPGRSSGWAVPFRLRKRWDLRLGDKAEVLPLLGQELDRVDVFLYDVPHSDPKAFREFASLDPIFPPNAVALVDHGGTTELCPSLRRWARVRGATASGRKGLGLYGFRAGRRRTARDGRR